MPERRRCSPLTTMRSPSVRPEVRTRWPSTDPPEGDGLEFGAVVRPAFGPLPYESRAPGTAARRLRV